MVGKEWLKPNQTELPIQDDRVEKVISEAIAFLPKSPSARVRIDKAVVQMESRGGIGRFVYPKREIHSALQQNDAAYQLVEMARRQPYREILIRAAPIDPWLQGLILTPAEKNYTSNKVKDKTRFVRERAFLTHLLCEVSGEDIEAYLRKAIDRIDFLNPAMTPLTSSQRQDVLLAILKQHLIFGQSFYQIRNELVAKLGETLPGEIVFSKYFGTLVFLLAEKWPEAAQNYHLQHRADCVISGREAAKRLARVENRERHFEAILASKVVPLSVKTAIRAFSSATPTSLENLVDRYPHLKEYFLIIMDRRVHENPEYMPALELTRIIDFFFFSENIWLIPEDQNPELFNKSPHQIFLEVAQAASTLPPAKYHKLRLQAFEALVRYMGVRGIREYLASLPGKTEQKKIRVVEQLQKEAPPDLDLKETTARVYVSEIAAVICEIMDGPSVWGPQMMEKDKLIKLIFRKSSTPARNQHLAI